MSYLVRRGFGYESFDNLGSAASYAVYQDTCDECDAELGAESVMVRYPAVRPSRDVYLKTVCFGCAPATLERIHTTLEEENEPTIRGWLAEQHPELGLGAS